MKKKTKLIVLEGCDASGKSTQIKLILNFLKENNIKHDFIHFPAYGNNEASKIIELYLRGEFGNINEVNPIFIASIYALDRYLYLPIIRKKLFENDVII